ncbi:MAG: F0F1 ATP synthase subunit delta [Eggerthellaceae bacterium]|jgi:F-type H+-transporting ATPase subunit delta
MKTNRLITNGKIAAYSEALVDNIAKEGGREALIEARGEIRWIIRYLRSKPEFIEAIGDDSYTEEQEFQLIQAVFKGFNPVLLDVVGVMAGRRDMQLLPRVFHAFDQRLFDNYDLVAVDVTTAVELDDHLRDVIRAKIKNDFGKEAIINEQINKNMLGGIVMSAQGKRIDASVRSQLDKARVALKSHKTQTEVNASD